MLTKAARDDNFPRDFAGGSLPEPGIRRNEEKRTMSSRDYKRNKMGSGALDRRSFLRVSALSSALPLALPGRADEAGGASSLLTVPPVAAQGELLPPIPKPADLASDRLVHHFRDLFNPPAAQNEWGYLQATKSVSGITAISFPPFSCCGVPEIPFSPGSLITCELFLNGQILTAYAPPAGEVAYTWYPHRIVREMVVEGIRFRTETFLPSQQLAAAELVSVKNEAHERRNISLGFDLRAGVTVKRGGPWFIYSPAEADNKRTPSESHGCVVFEAQHSRAVSVQGVSPRPTRIEQGRMLVHECSLSPGETRTFHYLNLIGEDKDAALDAYDRQQANFEGLLQQNEARFTSILHSAFTPGNSEFSGHLPQLATRSRELWKLYYAGFTNLLINRRVAPDSFYGTTYVTIPRVLPTLSFIWDMMLTSLSLSLLDPQALRRLVENWLVQDMHAHLATDYLTGHGVGPWYAVNDMGILRCADNYLRVTGDFTWLEKNVEGKPMVEHLVDHALYWKKLDRFGHGLADYGNLDDLLEVVSTWIHEVPAMNAGNVYGMRFAASLLERRGDARAAQLRSEARDLAARINHLLYVEGQGWWKCGQPDGTFNEVRHCYDLLTVLDTMFEDLSAKQKQEMSHFFWRELHTPLWMHALSPRDADATWNIRADHSWLGAYPAWPSMTAKGLYKIDPSAKVAGWMKGVSKSANQGPFGQAHMAETIFPPENGGAFKCPFEKPYENDWCCVSGGSYTDLVIDSIFGVDFTLFDGLRVNSRLGDFDPAAELRQVNYQGKSHVISVRGAHPA